MKKLAIALAAWMWAGAAWAGCATVEPVITPQVRLNPLDASGPAELVQTFNLTFRRSGAEGLPLVLRYQIVDEDSSVVARVGRTQGPQIDFQATASSRSIAAFRSEAYAALRSGSVVMGANEAAATAPILLRLTNLRDDLAAGVYREQFTVRYWCGAEEDSLPFEQPAAVVVNVAVPNVLSANIAGASARGEIDFLDFATRQRSLQIAVRSTGPFRVSASSLNNGVMKRDGAAAPKAEDLVGYRARLDGQSLDLAGGATAAMARVGLAGRQIPLDVEVEDVRSKRAGLYADTLLLTLTPAN